MKADIGWCCHHRINICCRHDTESASLQSSGAAQLTGGVHLPSTVGGRTECNIGDAGTISSRLVVIGICWRGAFKVFLELLQRQGLQQSRDAQSGQEELQEILSSYPQIHAGPFQALSTAISTSRDPHV